MSTRERSPGSETGSSTPSFRPYGGSQAPRQSPHPGLFFFIFVGTVPLRRDAENAYFSKPLHVCYVCVCSPPDLALGCRSWYQRRFDPSILPSDQAAEEFDEKGVMASAKERMDKSVESVRLNLETLRTGRAK